MSKQITTDRTELNRTLSKWGIAGGACGGLWFGLIRGSSYLGVEGVFGAWLDGAFGGFLGAAVFCCAAGAILAPKHISKVYFITGIVGCLGLITAVDAYRFESVNGLDIEPSNQFIVYVDNRKYWVSTRNPDQYDGTSDAERVVSYYEQSLAQHGLVEVEIRWRPFALEKAENLNQAEAEALSRAKHLATLIESVGGEKPEITKL